jgi:uncharacterized protein (TIGR02284 family)
MLKANNLQSGQPIYQLILILEEIKKGYLKAADKVKDQVLSLLFRNFGYQKIRYINELRHFVNNWGDTEFDQFTISLLQRTCSQLKHGVKHKQHGIVESCIKGEEAAIENYSTAIQQVRQYDEVRAVLQQQVNGIKTVLNTIKEYTAKSYC